MSLVPIMSFFDDGRLDQHFGLPMDMVDDLFLPVVNSSRHYSRPWRRLAEAAARLQDSGSKIVADKDKYQVCLDVKQFAPEEITVKTVGNQIVVEGKHEEKRDDHGYVSRHFVRKYELPKDYKAEEVVSSLSSDGVLSITAPKPQALPAAEGERIVPITSTGPVHKSVKANPM